jgi:Asp-tRNA(Asn)/Glu-tRNA(Gln) amidotransferase B subunit
MIMPQISRSPRFVFEAMGKQVKPVFQQQPDQKSDAGELEKSSTVLAENPDAVKDVTSGGKKEKGPGFLLGQVKIKGQATGILLKSLPNENLSSMMR